MLRQAYILLIALASLIRAQPVIDHLAVDEAQNRLLIYGSFGSSVGTVTVDDTTLDVLSWSDSLIYVALPNQGKGAGGDVVVADISGTSLPRILSIIKLKISNPYYHVSGGPGGSGRTPILRENRIWDVNWRADLNKQNLQTDTLLTFEVSRSSLGYRGHPQAQIRILPWADTSEIVDSSIALLGTVDIKNSRIIFDSAKLTVTPPFIEAGYTVAYKPLAISFDSTGYISGYVDSGNTYDPYPGTHWDNRIYDQQILFPPSPKIAVVTSLDESTYVSLRIFSNYIELINPRSQRVSITLSDYLGREVRRIYNGHLSQGSHNFPVTPFQHSTYFLVVKMEVGRIIKKIIQ